MSAGIGPFHIGRYDSPCLLPDDLQPRLQVFDFLL
jgi:hypothetical protein